MLGKLIKNEWKAMARNFLPVYLVMLAVTFSLKLVLEITEIFHIDGPISTVLTSVLMISFVLSIIAVVFGTVIIIIKRFYDNMLKDEGYLSFTLPVSTGQHITSKALTAYLWVMISVVVIVLSIVVLFSGHASFFEAVSESLHNGTRFLSDNGYWGYAFGILIAMLLAIYTVIMEAYVCMSVGQLFHKHRVAGAVIVYLVIYAIEQVCGTAFLTTLMIGSGDMVGLETNYETEFFIPFLIFILVTSLVESVIFTLITHIMLNRKLNLE